MAKAARRPRAPSGKIRIIGGKWRGRRLEVAPSAILRPSPDRVRETLFNWLQPYIDGARCLDLFAGTGVLGLEAISRGAATATLVERDADVAALLRQHLSDLAAEGVTIVEQDVLTWLGQQTPLPHDLAFLDPPFERGYLEGVLEHLRRGWLKDDAKVYLESEKLPILQLEKGGWLVLREGHTRHVSFALIQRSREADS